MMLDKQGDKTVYSDGRETERRMLEIACNYPEEQSEAIISGSYDYTTNNTFSPVRRNLLNWYPFRSESSVLEIGAGMGSLTGLLSDRCAQVTALEMNENRAAVIRARYPKRNNLQVIVGDLNHLTLSKKFDYVIFVGVLEYAALFSNSDDPFTEFLRAAMSFLKVGGRLLFAIENQYGLKYWCGASEDHVQQPFAGIAGYEKPRTARTFSRAALERLLRSVGLEYQRFYATLPDYKFPTMLFTDEWKPSGSDLINIAYTYGQNSLLVADERKLYTELAENGVVSFFANSFFVEAAAEPLEAIHPILVTARGENLPQYRIITILTSDQRIQKHAACPQAEAHLRQIAENEQTLEIRDIPILKMQMEDCVLTRSLSDLPRADTVLRDYLRRSNLNGVEAMVKALRSALLKSSELVHNAENALIREGIAAEDEDFGSILQNGYLDMTFYNAFWDGTTLIFFDQEWCVPGLPVEFILYYAVKCIFARGEEDKFISQERVLASFGFNPMHQACYDQLENIIWGRLFTRQGDFYGAGGYCTQYHNTNKLSTISDQLSALIAEKEQLQAALQCKDGHIELLLESERELTAEVDKKNDTIAQKSATVAEKEQIINRQLTTLVEKERMIARQLAAVAQKEQIIAGQTIALVKKEQTIAGQSVTLSEKERIIARQSTILAEKEQIIRNKEGHIELLLESERELDRIRSSRSWRFMGHVWKLRDALIPKGSKRRLFGKMLVKFVKHPLRFLSKCTPYKICKFIVTLRREGVESTSRRLDSCLIGNRIPPQELTIKEVAESGPGTRTKTAADYEPLHVPIWNPPMVSIVIPVYNQFEYTYACVKSILQNSGHISYEILIADDCSTDLTQDIETIITGLRSIRNLENMRFLRNCNHAAEFAQGKYILFLNNDTQVQDNWLVALVEPMEKDQSIGMTGSKLVYPDGRLQEAGGILWRNGSAWNYGNRADPTAPEYNYVKDVDYVSGASICIRKTLWKEIGGFDDRFAPAYYEDSDLAFEVRKHGFRVVYQPFSVVVHFEGRSNGLDITTGQKRYQVVNQKKFYEKWKDVLEVEHFPNAENVFQARDRSRNKLTVLLIDHYVPMYDKDAGSRTIYQYLQMLIEMGYCVKFIGDNFYPHEPYTKDLQQMGIEVLYGPYYANHWKDWVRRNGRFLSVAFMNRPHITEKYIDFIKDNTNARIIYNLSDLHFLRERREYEVTGNIDILKSSEQWEKKEFHLMELADTIYTLSTVERDIIDKRIQPSKTALCPVFIYNKFVMSLPDRKNTQDLMFVGGFNHHPNVDAMQWFCSEIFPIICSELPEIRLHIIGSNPPGVIQQLASKQILVEGFVTDDVLKKFYRTCRICVIPLRFGAGIKGKTIEAMYNAIPIVTTSTGIEGLPDIGACLPASDTAKEFAERTLAVYRGEKADTVVNCYEYVRSHFSRDAAETLFAQTFRPKENDRDDLAHYWQ